MLFLYGILKGFYKKLDFQEKIFFYRILKGFYKKLIQMKENIPENN